MKNKLIGLILLPLLYVRWSFIIAIIFCICIAINGDFLIKEIILMGFLFLGTWAISFWVLFGALGLMNPLTKLLLKSFRVEYEHQGEWLNTKTPIGNTVWGTSQIKIKGKEYKLSFALAGGNIYNAQANLRRDILFIFLLR